MSTLDKIPAGDRKKVEKVFDVQRKIVGTINKSKTPTPLVIAALFNVIVDCYVQMGIRDQKSLPEIKELIFQRLVNIEGFELAILGFYNEAYEIIKKEQD